MLRDSLQIEHTIGAPIAEIWTAWTSAERLCAWDPDRVDGEVVAGQHIVMHWDSFGVALNLEVVSCTENEALRLRAQRPDGSTQELLVEFEERSDDKTGVRLSFAGEMSEDERAGTAAGWHTQLRLLDRFLSLPRARRESFAALGPAVVSIDRAYAAFARPVSWLSLEPIYLHEEGQAFAMTTVDGVPLSGDVLSLVEGRELGLWCRELNGVVRMRALPLAGGRARLLGLQVVRWGECENAHLIQESLRESVDRLLARLGGPTGTA